MEELLEKLNNVENVVDLVLLTMEKLPDEIPSVFENNYKPIAAAGTFTQKIYLAQLLRIYFAEKSINHIETENKFKENKTEPLINVFPRIKSIDHSDASIQLKAQKQFIGNYFKKRWIRLKF